MNTFAASNMKNVWASVQRDEFYDLIPVASFVTNAVDLGEKMKMAWNRAYPPKEAATPPAKPDLDKQHYYRHLKEKSVFRCVVAMVPVFGNLCIYLYDRWNKDYADFNKMVDLICEQRANSGVVDTFKKASLELRCNQKFINAVERQLSAMAMIQPRPGDKVINFTDLLTYAGQEVIFTEKIMNRDNFAEAVKHNKGFLKLEVVGEQYERSGKIYADFCDVLCEEHPMEFVKVDPKIQGYSLLVASCVTKDPEIWTEFNEKVIFNLGNADGPVAECLLALRKMLTEKLEKGEDITPWVKGLFRLTLLGPDGSVADYMHDEGYMRASARWWPLLVDYRLYECARKLDISFKNWPQDSEFMSSLVNLESNDRNEYYLARYCDFDVLGLPEGPIRRNLVAALQKLQLENHLSVEELSPRLCTDDFNSTILGQSIVPGSKE